MTTSNTTIKTGQCEYVMDGTRCRTFHSKELSIFCGEHDVSIGMADPQTMEISFYNEPPLGCLPDAESDLSQPLYRGPSDIEGSHAYFKAGVEMLSDADRNHTYDIIRAAQNRLPKPNSVCHVCGNGMITAIPTSTNVCSDHFNPDWTPEEAGVERSWCMECGMVETPLNQEYCSNCQADNLWTCMGDDCDNQVSEIRQQYCYPCEVGDSAAPETEPYVTINIRESAVLGTEPKNVQFVTAEGGGFTRRMVVHRYGDGWAAQDTVSYNAGLVNGWYDTYLEAVTYSLGEATKQVLNAMMTEYERGIRDY